MKSTVWIHRLLTGLCFLPLDPETGPRFSTKDDCTGASTDWGWNGEGPPKDCDSADGVIFCFLRDAEIGGLGIESWIACPKLSTPSWLPPACLHSLKSMFNKVLINKMVRLEKTFVISLRMVWGLTFTLYLWDQLTNLPTLVRKWLIYETNAKGKQTKSKFGGPRRNDKIYQGHHKIYHRGNIIANSSS